MSEQAPMPQQPVDYLQEHPNAVVDPVKAELMAYASKGQEEKVVAHERLASIATTNIDRRGFEDSYPISAEHEATHQAELAQGARTEADKQAKQAASSYDRPSV